MISFKNKKASDLVKEIAESVVPCSRAKSFRNVFKRWCCVGQNVTVWLHEIQTVRGTLQDYDYGVKATLRSLIGE